MQLLSAPTARTSFVCHPTPHTHSLVIASHRGWRGNPVGYAPRECDTYHKSLSICWGMALSGMLHQNDNPNTNIFNNSVFGIFTRSFSYCCHLRWSIPNFLDINSVPTPNIAREFFNSRPAVINVSNSSRKIVRLNFCRLLSGIIFSPIVFINKNTAVINGGWRLRTINRNSVVYSNIFAALQPKLE